MNSLRLIAIILKLLLPINITSISLLERTIKPTNPLSLKMSTSLEMALHYLYKVIATYPVAFMTDFDLSVL